MSVWGALAGGVVGTIVMTTALRAASELGLTRIDIPFLLGTAVTGNRVRAKAVGYALHFVWGVAFALVYYAIFLALGASSWWLGALLGLVHGLFAGTALVNVLLPLVHPRMATPLASARDTPLLEAPGFLLMNYGPRTAPATVAAHVIYGVIVGAFIAASG